LSKLLSIFLNRSCIDVELFFYRIAVGIRDDKSLIYKQELYRKKELRKD